MRTRLQTGRGQMNNENQKEISVQLIAFMAHVEGTCQERGLVPPIDVTATDVDGNVWEFDYSPEYDWVDLSRVAPKLPITLSLIDGNGDSAEVRITDLNPRPEWMRPFLQ